MKVHKHLRYCLKCQSFERQKPAVTAITAAQAAALVTGVITGVYALGASWWVITLCGVAAVLWGHVINPRIIVTAGGWVCGRCHSTEIVPPFSARALKEVAQDRRYMRISIEMEEAEKKGLLTAPPTAAPIEAVPVEAPPGDQVPVPPAAVPAPAQPAV